MSSAPTYEPIPTAAATARVESVPSAGYWTETWRNFRRRKLSMLALVFVGFLCLVALFAPAIVGTKPIVCKYKGSIYFPCMGYFARAWENPIFFKDRFRGLYATALKQKDPESWAIWPLVYQDPYRRIRDN
jgi:peptide/nickel transport system permease protein